jgi:hypothetical protein
MMRKLLLMAVVAFVALLVDRPAEACRRDNEVRIRSRTTIRYRARRYLDDDRGYGGYRYGAPGYYGYRPYRRLGYGAPYRLGYGFGMSFSINEGFEPEPMYYAEPYCPPGSTIQSAPVPSRGEVAPPPSAYLPWGVPASFVDYDD